MLGSCATATVLTECAVETSILLVFIHKDFSIEVGYVLRGEHNIE